MPVVARDYYSFVPTRTHQTGDIWSGLPTFGILPLQKARGLVITPACDLENLKVEMVTYLPIIPVRLFLRGPAIIKALKGKLIGLLAAERHGVEWPGDSTLPALREIVAARERIEAIPEGQRGSGVSRCLKMLICLQAISEGTGAAIASDDLAGALGASDYGKLREDIIRNRRSDTHFLPSDGEPEEVSAIPGHSAVLFRYALSVPIDVLEAANVGNSVGWATTMRSIAAAFPVAPVFEDEMPIKRARLQNDFLGDLLTRYVGTYVRLGSPDFTDTQISSFAEGVG